MRVIVCCLSLQLALHVTAAPILQKIVARNPGTWVDPPLNGLPYLGLLAIAICVPIIVILLLMYLYRRRHGHFPRFGRKRGNISAQSIINPAVTARSRSRGVWRTHQPEQGLPGYTMEASGGEMSLGVGRKRSDELEEYEMAETFTTEHNSGEQRGIIREDSVEIAHEAEETPPTAVAVKKPTEALPPYIPPPTPALVANGEGLGRVSSLQSWGSIVDRLSFPRAVTTASRRSNRVEP